MKKRRIAILIATILVGLVIYFLAPFEHKFFLRSSTRNVIEKPHYYIDSWGWRLYFNGRYNDNDSYSFDKKERDTLKHLVLKIEDGIATDVFEYNKEFRSPQGKVHLNMNSEDTVYCFIEDHSGNKRFVIGGYYYKWTHLELKKSELDYFYLYMDSLSRVRGNHLPELPLLTKAEQVVFNRKFR